MTQLANSKTKTQPYLSDFTAPLITREYLCSVGIVAREVFVSFISVALMERKFISKLPALQPTELRLESDVLVYP